MRSSLVERWLYFLGVCVLVSFGGPFLLTVHGSCREVANVGDACIDGGFVIDCIPVRKEGYWK